MVRGTTIGEMDSFSLGSELDIVLPVPVGTNEKVKRFRDWLGLTTRELDKALGFKETSGRTFSYERKEGFHEPSRDYIAKARALAFEMKGIAPSVAWFFDQQDTAPDAPAANAPSETQGRSLPYRGLLPASIESEEDVLHYLPTRVEFSPPAGSGYWRIPDDSFSPYLHRGDLVLVSATSSPSHGAMAVVVAESQLQPGFTQRTSGGAIYRRLSEFQPELPDNARQIGTISEVVGQGLSGMRIAIECETGITEEMFKQIGR